MNRFRKWFTLRRALVALVISTITFLASYIATINANTPSRPYTSGISNDKIYLTLSREQLTAAALEIARGAGLVGKVVEQQVTEVSMGEWDETFDQIEGIRDPGRPVFIFAVRGEIDWNRGINIGFVAEDPNNPSPTLTPTPPGFHDSMTLVLDSQTGNGMAFYPHIFISAPLSPPRLEQILALSATPIPIRVAGTEPPPGYWETLMAPESQMTAQVYYWLTRTANAEAGTMVSTPQPDGSLVPLPPSPDATTGDDLRQP